VQSAFVKVIVIAFGDGCVWIPDGDGCVWIADGDGCVCRGDSVQPITVVKSATLVIAAA
jgi:hypothetical protein